MIWRTVPSFSEYEVSEGGRVRSSRGIKQGKVDSGGYLVIDLYRDGERVALRAHQIVMLAFVGPCPEGMETRHLDGDPANNHRSNLKYGTRSQQRHDDVRHGRHNMARKTHCKRGHPFKTENTYEAPDGKRYCRSCRRARTRRYRTAAGVSS